MTTCCWMSMTPLPRGSPLWRRRHSARARHRPRHRLGKTLTHNLVLLQRLSLFHGLGLPVLLAQAANAHRGTIGAEAKRRGGMPGSLAVALAGVAQGSADDTSA